MVFHVYTNRITSHLTQTQSEADNEPGFGEMREHTPGSSATMKKIHSFYSHKQKLINVE